MTSSDGLRDANQDAARHAAGSSEVMRGTAAGTMSTNARAYTAARYASVPNSNSGPTAGWMRCKREEARQSFSRIDATVRLVPAFRNGLRGVGRTNHAEPTVFAQAT